MSRMSIINRMKKETRELDIVIPISIELDWPDEDEVVSAILGQQTKYGFTRFALACPCGGWRSVGYPPAEHFAERARFFVRVRDRVAPYGISCGWWITATVKSGPSEDFPLMVRADGTNAPFANCPLNPVFRETFARNAALFASIAHPDFIFTEDDFSVTAAAGCFCEGHLAEFARRTGVKRTREEVAAAIAGHDETSTKLNRAWRELMKDSLVGLAEALRREVDRETPEIPIGYMQAGGSDIDGDCTEAIARAMAGERHVPFSRLYGCFYGGVNVRDIPIALFHPLHNRQHIGENFFFYHESDTFPHTRFYTSGSEMRAIMGAVYSYGFDGSTFQTQQLIDDGNEETAYGRMFTAERRRFNALYRLTDGCRISGVGLEYDPFYNTRDTAGGNTPLWTSYLAHFGIPYTTLDADVAFWDERQAKYYSHEKIIDRLSRGLFLDGAAAKRLCERGYGEYLGVDVGEDVTKTHECVIGGKTRTDMFGYDLGAREVIREPFYGENFGGGVTDVGCLGHNMPIAHMFSPGGNGQLLALNPISEKTEIISDAYTFQNKHVAPAMTRFENSLGGRVVVMGMTLAGNRSQSLFNYRRQRLIQQLILWCSQRASAPVHEDIPFVIGDARVFTIYNRGKDDGGMLTLINLSSDNLGSVALRLPALWTERLQNGRSTDFRLAVLDEQGELRNAAYIFKGDALILREPLRYLDPVYLVALDLRG